jgi:hypothetical protein
MTANKTKGTRPTDLASGKPSAPHEDIKAVLQGWDERLPPPPKKKGQKVKVQTREKKRNPLPSDRNPNYCYGMPTSEMDKWTNPFRRSEGVIQAREVASHEKEEAEATKMAKEGKKPRKKFERGRPTAASIGHTYKPPPEPGLKDTFKMKRFTKIDHGAINTGLGEKSVKPKE